MKPEGNFSFLKPPPFAQYLGIWAGIITAVLSAIALIWAAIIQIVSIIAYIVPLIMIAHGLIEFCLNKSLKLEELAANPEKENANSLRVFANLFAFNSTLLFIPIVFLAPLIEGLIGTQRLMANSLIGKTEPLVEAKSPMLFYLYCGIVLLVTSVIWGVNLINALRSQWQLDILKMNVSTSQRSPLQFEEQPNQD